MKHFKLLIVALSILSCSSDNSKTDIYRNNLDVNKDGITEILNPNIDIGDALALLPNARGDLNLKGLKADPIKAQSESYSPLLKYTAGGRLLPVFKEGSFSNSNIPSVTVSTQLKNGKTYVLFSDLIKVNQHTCSLIELSSQNTLRCIDDVTALAGFAKRASHLPREKSSKEDLIFLMPDGTLVYATKVAETQDVYSKKVEPIFSLMGRSPQNVLSVFSEAKVSKRLGQSIATQKLYTMCDLYQHCEIDVTGKVSPQNNLDEGYVYDFHLLDDETYISMSNYPFTQAPGRPIKSRLYYHFATWHLEDFLNLQSNPIKHITQIELPYSFLMFPEFCFGQRDEQFCFTNSFSIPGASFAQTFAHVNQSIQTSPVGYGYHFDWLASDWVSPTLLMVSGKSYVYSKTSFEYETWMYNTQTKIWTRAEALTGFNISSLRAAAGEVFILGKKEGSPTQLLKHISSTGQLTVLRAGEELKGTTIFSIR